MQRRRDAARSSSLQNLHEHRSHVESVSVLAVTNRDSRLFLTAVIAPAIQNYSADSVGIRSLQRSISLAQNKRLDHIAVRKVRSEVCFGLLR
jgi:hypothetical protein